MSDIHRGHKGTISRTTLFNFLDPSADLEPPVTAGSRFKQTFSAPSIPLAGLTLGIIYSAQGVFNNSAIHRANGDPAIHYPLRHIELW